MSHFIGIDLGGTKIAAIAYDADSQKIPRLAPSINYISAEGGGGYPNAGIR